jgi:hypothetical protein
VRFLWFYKRKILDLIDTYQSHAIHTHMACLEVIIFNFEPCILDCFRVRSSIFRKFSIFLKLIRPSTLKRKQDFGFIAYLETAFQSLSKDTRIMSLVLIVVEIWLLKDTSRISALQQNAPKMAFGGKWPPPFGPPCERFVLWNAMFLLFIHKDNTPFYTFKIKNILLDHEIGCPW